MLSVLLLAALHVKKLSHDSILMVYTCLYLYLVFRGRTYAWTLFYVCLEQRRGGIAYLLSWIDFLRWHTLYHVIKVMMLLMLLIYSFVRLFAYMVCPILLFWIVIQSFLAIFGDVYGLSWGLNYFLVLHVIPKLMDKLKWSIRHCLLCLGLL